MTERDSHLAQRRFAGLNRDCKFPLKRKDEPMFTFWTAHKAISMHSPAADRLILKFAAVASAIVSAANLAWAQIPKPTDAPRPMSPEETAAAFRLPDGFRMEVIASEPLVASPTAVCWDERGRMFVSELHGYNLDGQLEIEDLNKTGQLDTQVRRVEAAEQYKEAAKAGTFGAVKMLRD